MKILTPGRLANYADQLHAHDLAVELLRLVATHRNRGLSIEGVGQALMESFYRTCAHEAKGDPAGTKFLAQRLLEGGLVEYSLALLKEQVQIAELEAEKEEAVLQ